MKKGICTLVILCASTGSSFAENPFNSACQDMSKASKTIMDFRQQGYQQNTLVSLFVDTANNDAELDTGTKEIINTYLSDIVARAYKVPKYSGEKEQKKAAIDFQNTIKTDCEYRLKNLFK